MTLQEKAREWAEKRAKEMMNEPAMSSINQIMERAYLSGAAGAMEWVPVSEQTPQKGGYYLSGSTHRTELYISYYSTDDKSFYDSGITHWMPLPPHPEKESV